MAGKINYASLKGKRVKFFLGTGKKVDETVQELQIGDVKKVEEVDGCGGVFRLMLENADFGYYYPKTEKRAEIEEIRLTGQREAYIISSRILRHVVLS